MAGASNHGNEPSGFHKVRGIFDYIRTGYLLKKDSAPWRMEYAHVPVTIFRKIHKVESRNDKNSRATEEILQQVFIVPIEYFYICLAIFLYEYTT